MVLGTLPLVIFERLRPNSELRLKSVLEESRRLLDGDRFRALRWLLVWLLAVVVLNAVTTLIVGGIGSRLLPTSVGSLVILSARLGLLRILWFVAGTILNVLVTIALATMLNRGYLLLDSRAAQALQAVRWGESQGTGWDATITRTRRLLAASIGMLAALTIGFVALNGLPLEDKTLVMAHRGASKAAPENTLAAIRQAILDGADWVETTFKRRRMGRWSSFRTAIL